MSLHTKVFVWMIIEFIVFGLIFFISAGTAAWLAGWIYLLLFFGAGSVLVVWLLRHDPGLLEERMSFRPGQKVWDKVFIIALYSFFIIWLILMPLDAVRFHWSHMPVWVQILGALVFLYSFYLFYLIFRENPYASAVVRVQAERGQTVVSTGPYRYIRHPMYVGGILFFLGTALLLGSWYGVLMTTVFVVMLMIRIVLEERTLSEGLAGYIEYMAKVKYRLIPYIW